LEAEHHIATKFRVPQYVTCLRCPSNKRSKERERDVLSKSVSYQLVFDYLPSAVVLSNLLMPGPFCPEKHDCSGKMAAATVNT